mmetsp:Transcript_37820/g.36248  ORF Transcript_37820/g.36248 Transcript_37820/m.36248 type:complete len:122 (+) Transcript_37820:287-652(+)
MSRNAGPYQDGASGFRTSSHIKTLSTDISKSRNNTGQDRRALMNKSLDAKGWGNTASFNRTFYSFGGNTPIMGPLNHHPVINHTFSNVPKDIQQQERFVDRMVNYRHDPLVRVNDYTKNIS